MTKHTLVDNKINVNAYDAAMRLALRRGAHNVKHYIVRCDEAAIKINAAQITWITKCSVNGN